MDSPYYANEDAKKSTSTTNTTTNTTANSTTKFNVFIKVIEVCILSFLVYFIVFKGANSLLQSGEFAAFESTPESTVTFDDVIGCDESKQELQEIVHFLKNPVKFKNIGAKMTNGVLLIGPPGTGKTLLGKAIAGEAGVPFFYCSGSEFDEMFVGVGASRIRSIFAKARERTPCIIFIDELDALGGRRNVADTSYSRQTLNQLLVELDGFKQNEQIIIVGATNFPESLDKALIRAGRFDSHIYVAPPTFEERVKLLEYYMARTRHSSSESLDLKSLAHLTTGLSGADISNIVNQAAFHAASSNKDYVSMTDFEWAVEKIQMGRERNNLLMTDEDKRITAFHEAGHAIVAFYTQYANKLHKATIIPRGNSLGVTQILPERDRVHMTYKQLLAQIDVCMGGRAAEELIYGNDNVTTGCSSDLKSATAIAMEMVRSYGMSGKVGLATVSELNAGSSHVHGGGGQLSPETLQQIENSVKEILDESYKRAKLLLQKYAKQHKNLADALIKYETLNAEEMEKIIS